MGPYDQYVQGSSLFPVIPPPQDYDGKLLEEKPQEERTHGEPDKRQARDLFACITANECARKGTYYRDLHGQARSQEGVHGWGEGIGGDSVDPSPPPV